MPRQLSLELGAGVREGGEARLFTGVIGYQVYIIYTNFSEARAFGSAIGQDDFCPAIFLWPFFVSLLVSKKLRAGSAHPQHVMSQDRMIFWDPGFGRVQWPACACPQSPVFVCGATWR